MYIGLILALATSLVGCNKNPLAPGLHDNPPVSRPAGEPTGDQEHFRIGAAGGSFQSADGKLTVTVPAGAVANPTDFSLQPISNTSDAGVGTGFRLLPHGVQFEKPISIKFSYAHLVDSLPSEDVLSIAYQSQNGYWNMVRPHTLNKTEKTIETPSTHFSDWIMITWLKLIPVQSTLGANDKQTFTILNYHPYSDDLLAPLVSSDETTLPLGEGKPIPGNIVKRWQLNGPGKLEGKGNNATYTAPSTIGANKTATAVAHLESKQHQLMLLSHIQLVEEGIHFTINGGDWRHIPGHVAALADLGKSGLAGEGPNDVFTMIWQGTSGNFPWGYEGDGAQMTITPPGHSTYHGAFYLNGNEEVVISGGSIKVDNWGPVGTTVTGSFTVTPSGKFSGATGKQLAVENVEGFFRVKRIR